MNQWLIAAASIQLAVIDIATYVPNPNLLWTLDGSYTYHLSMT